MNPKKRGLGKGLEALLAHTHLEDSGSLGLSTASSSEDLTNNQQAAIQAQALKQALHQEHQCLLAEAEALLALIEAFEMVIRADMSDDSPAAD